MFNNNRSQAIFVGIMVMMMVFIVLVQLIGPLKEQIVLARDTNNLDCGNSSIPASNKGACVIIDWTFPYYIGMAIAVGASVLVGFGAKKLISKT